jgi:hypothetical protein
MRGQQGKGLRLHPATIIIDHQVLRMQLHNDGSRLRVQRVADQLDHGHSQAGNLLSGSHERVANAQAADPRGLPAELRRETGGRVPTASLQVAPAASAPGPIRAGS